ncbi:MAG: prepilin-type N-terminal cleavage/methylation domain-containing protein [Candidatus Hydrogenedentes bacterium]|nr:prepilin-type N-terminal cleavage/methylation domain-containing protein [Candidatus Hydrogenedentota bacterium]
MSRRGFTLLEVLVAMSILIVIVAVVYASFASVTDTMSVARVRTEEMRLRQFLERSIRTNLTSVYVDRAYEQQVFQFVGINDQNTEGPRDSLRFVSTNQLMGGLALPGDFKEVRYDVFGGEEGRVQLSADQKREREDYEAMDMNPDQAKLEATETPLLASNAQAIDTETGNIDLDNSSSQGQGFDQRRNQSQSRNENHDLNAAMYQAPSWSVPIRTLDITYYDGVEWVEEWDSTTMGRLPWCVQIRINFARTEEEIQREIDQNIDIENSPDFEMVVPLPIALGQQTDGRALNEAENAADEGTIDESNPNATPNTGQQNPGAGAGAGTGSGTTTGRPRPGGAGRPSMGRPGTGSGSIFGSGRSRPSSITIPRNLGGRTR